MGSSIRHLDEDKTRLAGLIRGYATHATENRRLIRGMLDDDRDRFYAATVEALKTPEDSRGFRYLISLLMGRDMLFEALSDPALSHDQAVAAARSASQVYSMMDVSLAKTVAGDGFSQKVAPARAKRMLDILSELSGGSHALGSLRSMLRHPDPYLRSKAVLMIGRGERGSGWAQHRMAEDDPRVRANVVEALWGRDTEEARAVLRSATSDPHNRVVGNALLGLYRLGDVAAISGLFQMAAKESEMFRASGAWAMGETGDPRFAELLARMLGDPSNTVRKRAFESLRHMKAAAARARQGAHLRVGARLEVGPDGLRRLELEAIHERGEPALVPPLGILLDEDGRPVVDYQVERRPGADPLTVVFVLPRPEGSAVPAWRQGALNALAWKRPLDVWGIVLYIAAHDRSGSVASSKEAGVEPTADRAEAEKLFDSTRERVYSRDLWGAMERALDPTVPGRGKRRLIVYSEHEAGTPEGRGDLAAAALERGASVGAICLTPDPPLEDLCRRTQGDFRIAGAAGEVEAFVERAHRAALDQYVVTYRGAPTGVSALRVRINLPDGWGEITLAAPKPSLPAAVA